jgi:hypothetical protein
MAGKKKRLDPASEGALEAARAQREAAELQEKEGELRERNIAFTAETVGTVKSMNFVRSLSDITLLMRLKDLKESKRYRAAGMTWEGVCAAMGLCRKTVDLKLDDLKPFRDDFLGNFSVFFSNDLRKIKYLGHAVSGKSAEIRDNAIIYKGEEIPLTPEHRDDIQDVLDQIQEDLGKDLDEAKTDLAVKDRLLKDNAKHAQKLIRELEKLEKEARDKDLTPEEDAFLKRMENLRIGFEGYMLKVEPQRMEELAEGASSLMRAEYLTTLWRMKVCIKAAYDTAVDLYGADLIEGEDDWQPGRKK